MISRIIRHLPPGNEKEPACVFTKIFDKEEIEYQTYEAAASRRSHESHRFDGWYELGILTRILQDY